MAFWYEGAYCGVDARSGLVHTLTGTAANVHDVIQAQALLYGDEVGELIEQVSLFYSPSILPQISSSGSPAAIQSVSSEIPPWIPYKTGQIMGYSPGQFICSLCRMQFKV